MRDNLVAIIIVPLFVVTSLVAGSLRLILEGMTWIAHLLGGKGAPAYASNAEEDLLS